eukprot:gb/GECG01008337.1/.p1 GENE.gb/GECG01008337.1/~~gb/GECG01008337.1/.p1  ORF type:complete len:2032 (+),score=256.00 gb/GECG01008337.1/:1-6096(+)
MPPKRAQKRSRSGKTNEDSSSKKGPAKASRQSSNSSSSSPSIVPSAAASCSAEALKLEQESTSRTPVSDHLHRLLESLSKSSSILLQLELGREVAEFVLQDSKQPASDRRHVFQFLVNQCRSTEWDQRRGASALASSLAAEWKRKNHCGLEGFLERVHRETAEKSRLSWNNLKLDVLEANKIASKGEHLLAFDEGILSQEIDEANARRSERYSHEELSKIVQWKVLESVGQGENNVKVFDGVKYGEAHKLVDYTDTVESETVRQQRLQRVRATSKGKAPKVLSKQSNVAKGTQRKQKLCDEEAAYVSPSVVTNALHEQLHTDEGLLHSIILKASVGLYDHRWEIRHGSCMVLNELLFALLFGDESSDQSREALESTVGNTCAEFYEDILMRSVSILLLDKFGDYSSGKVIAPVRQSAARLLSTICHFATAEMMQQIVKVLTQLFSKTDWHGRHGILLSLRELFRSNPTRVKEWFSKFSVTEVLKEILEDTVDDVQFTGVEVLNVLLEDDSFFVPAELLLALLRLALRSCSSEISCSIAVESMLPLLNRLSVRTLHSSGSEVHLYNFALLVITILHRFLNFSKGQSHHVRVACKLLGTVTDWVRETARTTDSSSLTEILSLLVDCSLSTLLMNVSVDESTRRKSLKSFFDLRDVLLGLSGTVSDFISFLTVHKWYHLLRYDRGELFYLDTWEPEKGNSLHQQQWESVGETVSAKWGQLISASPDFRSCLHGLATEIESSLVDHEVNVGDSQDSDGLSDIDVDDELIDMEPLPEPHMKKSGVATTRDLLKDLLFGDSQAVQPKLSEVLKQSSAQSPLHTFFEANQDRQAMLSLALAALCPSKFQPAQRFLLLKVMQGLDSNYYTLAINSAIVWMFLLAATDPSFAQLVLEKDVKTTWVPEELKYARNIDEGSDNQNLSDVQEGLTSLLLSRLHRIEPWLRGKPEEVFKDILQEPELRAVPVECKGGFSNFLLCFDGFLQAAEIGLTWKQKWTVRPRPEWFNALPFINRNLILNTFPLAGLLLTQELPSGSRTSRAEEEAKMQQQRALEAFRQSVCQIQSRMSVFALPCRAIIGVRDSCDYRFGGLDYCEGGCMSHMQIPYSHFCVAENDLLSRLYWSLLYHQFPPTDLCKEISCLLKATSQTWRSRADNCIDNMVRLSGNTLQWENPLVLQYFDDLQESYRRGTIQLIHATLLARLDSASIQQWINELTQRYDSSAGTSVSSLSGVKELLQDEGSRIYCTAFSACHAIALFMKESDRSPQDELSKLYLQVLDMLFPFVTEFGALPSSLKNTADAMECKDNVVSSALYDVLLDAFSEILSKMGSTEPVLLERLVRLSLISGQNRSIVGNSLCSKVVTLVDTKISYPLSSLLLRNALRSRSELSSLRETLAIANSNVGILFRFATEDCMERVAPEWCTMEKLEEDLRSERNSIKSFSLLQNDTVNQLGDREQKLLHGVLRGVELRQYQIEGIAWLLFLSKWGLNGCLADDMGLGKTLQALAAVAISAQQRKKQSTEYRCLIVCPASIVHHWSYEAQQYFGSPWFRCEHYYGARNRRERALEAFNTRVSGSMVSALVCSYGVLVKDILTLQQFRWDCCILDEAHVISNPTTKIATCIKQVPASSRIALTGTPIQNSLSDIWSIFDFLMPGYLGDKKSFRMNFEKPVSTARHCAKDESQLNAANDALKKLHYQMKGLVLRRTKDQVLEELPPKVIQDVTVELSKKQRELYQKHCNEEMTADLRRAHESRKSQEKSGGTETLSNLRKLQYICNDAALPSADGDTSSETDISTSSKLQALEDIIQNACLGRDPAVYVQSNESTDATNGSRKKSGTGKKPLEWKDVGSGLDTDNLVHSKMAHEAVQSTLVTTTRRVTDSKEEETPVQKLLIFSRFPAMLDAVETKLLKQYFPSVKYSRIDGGTPVTERQNRAREFNENSEIKLMLLTTGVGNLGLNLASANIVVFIDHSWNPFNDLQAMDRAHRLGQKQTVFVNRLIAKDTIEEEIMNVQEFKKLVSASVIAADEESPSAVSASALANDQ